MTEHVSHDPSPGDAWVGRRSAGAPDRGRLRAEMAQDLEAGDNRPFAVLSVGLDRFDDVNGVFGFDSGDRLLEAVRDRLAAAFKDARAVARVGGDEFAIWADPRGSAIQRTVERLFSVFADPFDVEGEPLVIDATVGAAVYPEHGVDPDRLLRRAHLAMRAAKRERRAFGLYRAEADEPSVANVRRLRALRDAMARNQLVLHYQPRVDTATGAVTGCEALVRWPVADHLEMPADFLPLCERTGLMRSLDRWVLASAARQVAAWSDRGLHMPVSVNVSARSFDAERLPQAVFAAMDLWGIAGSDLAIEVTEGAIEANPAAALRATARLADLGVSVAIDHFGAGRCPLVYLRDFKTGSIKIADTFVRGVAQDRASAAIAQTVIDLGRRLGLGVVAEGAEDRATLDRLRDMGCPEVQGYSVAAPMPADAFPSWLQRTGRPLRPDPAHA